MNRQELARRTEEITETLRSSDLGKYIDRSGLVAPIPFRGEGEIKLIVLAQDPTVRKMRHRQELKVTLQLDKEHAEGRLPKYLRDICGKLGLDLDQNLYATNIVKNFFTDRPDQIDRSIIQRAFPYWAELLNQELGEFKDIPIITLGEPVINCFMPKPIKIKYYWGFQGPRLYNGEMKHIVPTENTLQRHIFPFAHIHGLKYSLYNGNLTRYVSYMKEYVI